MAKKSPIEENYDPQTGEVQTDLEEYLRQPRMVSQQDMNHDKYGREIPDPVPMAPPVGYTPPFSMVAHLKEIVRRELSEVAASQELETYEDADDFDIEDDPIDPHTPYEAVFDPPPPSTPPPPPTSRPIPEPPADGPLKSAPAAPTVPIVDKGPTVLDAG